MKIYRLIAFVFSTLVMGYVGYLSIDLWGVEDLFADVPLDLLGKTIGVLLIPQALNIFLCILDRRLWFVPSFGSLALCWMIAGTGAWHIALAGLLLVPYVCALLAIFAPRFSFKDDGEGTPPRTIAEHVGAEWFHWTKD